LPAAIDPLQGWLIEAFDLRALLNTHVTALFRDSHLPTALYKRRNFFDQTPAAVVGMNGRAVFDAAVKIAPLVPLATIG
jgi:hypothetical protein